MELTTLISAGTTIPVIFITRRGTGPRKTNADPSGSIRGRSTLTAIRKRFQRDKSGTCPGRSLGKCLRHSLFPTPLRLQYEFYNLARSTVSSEPARREMANSGQLGCAVGYTHSQSGSACQRNVGKIVAQIGNFLF